MPITVITGKERKLESRGLIIGSPNTGKTRLLNFIEEERVLVVSFPDEKGVKSIPMEKDNITSILFGVEPLPEEAEQSHRFQRSKEKYHVVLTATRRILKGEFGSYDVLYLDGFSKFYETILDVVCKGRYLKGDVFEETGSYTTRLYQASHT